MERLIRFLGIDTAARHEAKQLWPLISGYSDQIIGDFYATVQTSGIDIPLTDQVIDHLKIRQAEHWRTLFDSRFDHRYFSNASLIGIKHCEIGLDPKWYIAGYTRIKGDFAAIILDAPLPMSAKARLIGTLDKYVALDMALAISSYTSVLVD